MSTLTKTLLATLAITLVGGGAYVAAAPGGHSPTPAAPAAADVKGPCDEAEHANDPRCAGTQVPEDNPNQVEHHHANQADDNPGHDLNDDNGADDVNDDNDDNPGEVEHHDNRGPGSHHDNSGPGSENSGPGNAEDQGDDNAMEDNSGPGSGSSSQSVSDDSGSSHSGSDDSGSGGSDD